MKIEITEKAVEELKNVIDSKKETSKNKIRLFIAGIGWGGPSFGIALDEQKENDVVYSTEELDFVAEEFVSEQYGAFTIDFTNSWRGKGFSIEAEGVGSC